MNAMNEAAATSAGDVRGMMRYVRCVGGCIARTLDHGERESFATSASRGTADRLTQINRALRNPDFDRVGLF